MSTVYLSIESKTTLLPKLRFMGFDEEWKLEKFGKLATNKSGKFNPIKENSFTKCIELEHLETGTGQLLGFIDGSNSGSIKNKFNEGDVLFGKLRPYLKKYLQAPFEGVCSSEIWVLKGVKITNSFLYQLVQTNKFIDIANQSSGSKMPRADWNVVENCVFTIPTLPEQQKIASFLSAVDEKIQQLTRKKKMLEKYKKGVMQQLFSGKLRFKNENGNDYADWEEKKLGDVAKYYDGTHQTPNYVETGIPFYSVEHVTADQFTKSKYISKEVFEKENKRVKLEKGDILMTRIGDIGTSRLIDWDIKASFYVSLALIKQNEKYNSTFLNQYISSVYFQKELWANTIHVAFPKKINLGEIGKCKIKFPSLPEQQKIANFLSSIDTKIESTRQQLNQTQSFKKGLLQQLFV
ncbi:restriction endonuclease subunit S [Flavobacterium sp. LB3P122]|uniref:restriction endonuclease subunit S n=1 Tax=Flavobacterium algoriphilum TaxID=3398738 RepID=UPI003A88B194